MRQIQWLYVNKFYNFQLFLNDALFLNNILYISVLYLWKSIIIEMETLDSAKSESQCVVVHLIE